MDLRRTLARLVRCERGVALVEFGIALPLLLVLFAATIESARMLWAYQGVVAGVRDAARYAARVTPGDVCASGGSLGGLETALLARVRTGSDGSAVLPSGVTVTGLTTGLDCVAGGWRGGAAPVARVSASLTITVPFGPVFTLVGTAPPTIRTVVTDRQRVTGS